MSAHPTWAALRGGSLPALALLYVALFGAFGMESPFFPSYLAGRKLGPREIAAVLAVGTVVRIAAGPALGLLADRVGVRRVLAGAAAGAGTIILLYLLASSLPALLLVAGLHSLMVTPLNPLCDALAVEASRREGTYPYGWVRGIGSAGFVAATVVSGFMVTRLGLSSTLVSASSLFLLMLPPLLLVPPTAAHRESPSWRDAADLLSQRPFRRMLLVAALVIGSHVMSSTFAIIHWRSRGLSAEAVALLWAVAIVAEIGVFMVAGPYLLRRFGIARCATIAAAAAVVRWGIVASTVQAVPLVFAQASQGLTFALMHLACMEFIAGTVPPRLAATAQALYGALALGAASALLTLASGEAYAQFGASAFWSMSALCLPAVVVGRRLGRST